MKNWPQFGWWRSWISIALVLCCSLQTQAQGRKKHILNTIGHVALGFGVKLGVSTIAGGPQCFTCRASVAGLVSAGLVAGFKEGSDALAGRDTNKQAAVHALTQMGGAFLASGVTF